MINLFHGEGTGCWKDEIGKRVRDQQNNHDRYATTEAETERAHWTTCAENEKCLTRKVDLVWEQGRNNGVLCCHYFLSETEGKIAWVRSWWKFKEMRGKWWRSSFGSTPVGKRKGAVPGQPSQYKLSVPSGPHDTLYDHYFPCGNFRIWILLLLLLLSLSIHFSYFLLPDFTTQLERSFLPASPSIKHDIK